MTNLVEYRGRPHRIMEYPIVFEDCFTCGIPIAMTPAQLRQFDEKGMSIKCVLGHSTVRRETDNQRLQRELESAQSRVTRLETQVRNTEQMLDVETKARKTLVKRINAGVCPHCHRTFQQVARHMKSKHPEVAL